MNLICHLLILIIIIHSRVIWCAVCSSKHMYLNKLIHSESYSIILYGHTCDLPLGSLLFLFQGNSLSEGNISNLLSLTSARTKWLLMSVVFSCNYSCQLENFCHSNSGIMQPEPVSSYKCHYWHRTSLLLSAQKVFTRQNSTRCEWNYPLKITYYTCI